MPRICLARDVINFNKTSHEILFYFDINDVYTSINAHWLKINPEHAHMRGYFGNSLKSLLNCVLYNCHLGELDPMIGSIDDRKRFIAIGDNRMDKKEYTYFLPEDKVTWVNKHLEGYRPYKTVEELLDDIPTEAHSRLRYLRALKKEGEEQQQAISKVFISGVLNSEIASVDNEAWSMNRLFSTYERLDKDGWWRPFGKRNVAANTKYTAYDYDTHVKALAGWD